MSIRQQLIHHEGLRLKPYRCSAGKLTIGVGRNLEDVGISREEAMRLLDNDIGRCRGELADSVPAYLRLDETRKNVLIDMCFNLGIAGLLEFENMLAAVEAGDYDKAADEMLNSKWAGQVGKRADTLAEMMRRGG